jgi:hypothetical protein
MTHFLQDMKAGRQSPVLGRSCLAVQYDLHLGPPKWFVPPEANTTTHQLVHACFGSLLLVVRLLCYHCLVRVQWYCRSS